MRAADGADTFAPSRPAVAIAMLAFAVALSPALARATTHPSLSSVSLQAGAGGATLSLALSGEAPLHDFTLADPYRIVLDFSRVRVSAGLQVPSAQGLVRDVRVAAQPDGSTRVVLELDAPHDYHLSFSQLGRHGQQWRVDVAAAADASRAPEPPRPVQAVHAPRSSGRDVVIAVDAGHGGSDPGASGRAGTHEKDVTLAIARRLAALIDAEQGMHAVLTRDRDVFVPLRERMNRARAAHADMLVSVHADAVRDRQVDGASVYILSERGASSEAARWLAEQENAADLRGGISLAEQQQDLASVLLNLSQSASIGNSVEAADMVLAALDDVGAIRRREVQQAGFLVLKAPDMPSMLVETAYISNPAEERRLRSADYQNKLAAAIQRGVRDYFRLHPPDGTLFAAQRAVSNPPITIAQGTP